jgi:4-methylaminobutanoate oxidase (formaldehyde-forming)
LLSLEVDATAALAKGAKQQGARLFEGVSVASVLDDGRGRVTGVQTSDGHVIKAEYVVNCGGMWARQLAEQSRVIVPNQAAEHYYLITDAIEGVDPNWPVQSKADV